jgi:hypothetical protein
MNFKTLIVFAGFLSLLGFGQDIPSDEQVTSDVNSTTQDLTNIES